MHMFDQVLYFIKQYTYIHRLKRLANLFVYTGDHFYDHLEYLTAIWYNLWPFGIVCVHLV
jgi:hypothetical protein